MCFSTNSDCGCVLAVTPLNCFLSEEQSDGGLYSSPPWTFGETHNQEARPSHSVLTVLSRHIRTTWVQCWPKVCASGSPGASGFQGIRTSAGGGWHHMEICTTAR